MRLAERLVPKVGLEPTPPCGDRILSPARLPFRHFGKSWWVKSYANSLASCIGLETNC